MKPLFTRFAVLSLPQVGDALLDGMVEFLECLKSV